MFVFQTEDANGLRADEEIDPDEVIGGIRWLGGFRSGCRTRPERAGDDGVPDRGLKDARESRFGVSGGG